MELIGCQSGSGANLKIIIGGTRADEYSILGQLEEIEKKTNKEDGGVGNK